MLPHHENDTPPVLIPMRNSLFGRYDRHWNPFDRDERIRAKKRWEI